MSLATPPSLLSLKGRPWAALALALLLLVAQGLWSAHETLHVTDGHDADCALCLIGGGAAAGLPVAQPPVVPFGAAVATLTPILHPAVPYQAVFRPQSPRAPPFLASIIR